MAGSRNGTHVEPADTSQGSFIIRTELFCLKGNNRLGLLLTCTPREPSPGEPATLVHEGDFGKGTALSSRCWHNSVAKNFNSLVLVWHQTFILHQSVETERRELEDASERPWAMKRLLI